MASTRQAASKALHFSSIGAPGNFQLGMHATLDGLSGRGHKCIGVVVSRDPDPDPDPDP